MSDQKDKKPIQLSINPQYDSNFERMFKDFQKESQKNGLLKELKDRRYYKKPSDIRHKLEGTIARKRKLARRRRRKK